MATIRVCSFVVDWVSADTPIKTTINQQQNERYIMAIGVIATIPVQEGKNDEFETVFVELAAQV